MNVRVTVNGVDVSDQVSYTPHLTKKCPTCHRQSSFGNYATDPKTGKATLICSACRQPLL